MGFGYTFDYTYNRSVRLFPMTVSQWCVNVLFVRSTHIFSVNRCMESAEGQRMIQKHDELMQLLKRLAVLEIPVEMFYLFVIYRPIYLPPSAPVTFVWLSVKAAIHHLSRNNPAISITTPRDVITIAITLFVCIVSMTVRLVSHLEFAYASVWG